MNATSNIAQARRQSLHMPWVAEEDADPEESHSMLAEVDFKWLMAGEGWWVDTTRLHDDAAYASHLLSVAMASKSAAVRAAAAALLMSQPRSAAV